jgi:predicted lipoprotein with Yx(FWY)xxD motif
MRPRTRLRTLALAFAVPVVTIGTLALAGHVASSSAAPVVKVAATDNTTSRSGSATTSASPGPSSRPGAAGVNCVRNHASTSVTVKIAHVSGKDVLVDADGCALYVNTKDTARASTCTAACQATWIPVRGPAQAGIGANQTNLGTFTRADGKVQATFVGQQLYYFARDTRPGQASGLGADSRFFLIDQNGKPLTN